MRTIQINEERECYLEFCSYKFAVNKKPAHRQTAHHLTDSSYVTSKIHQAKVDGYYLHGSQIKLIE